MKEHLQSFSNKGLRKAKGAYRAAMKSSPGEVKFTVAGSVAGLSAGTYIGGAVGIAGFLALLVFQSPQLD
jgi:hypothetical protein